MGYYKVRFDDYCLSHHDSCTYFEYFEFNNKKYPIGAYVTLTEEGISEMFYGHGYNYVKGGFRLVDHYIMSNGVEEWKYIIGKTYETSTPVFYNTTIKPDILISEVLWKEFDETVYTPGELQIEFKEHNYFPKDWEVDGVIFGWIVFTVLWILLFVLKPWWFRLIIQIGVGIYFGRWRDNKINEAIRTQKFKKE